MMKVAFAEFAIIAPIVESIVIIKQTKIFEGTHAVRANNKLFHNMTDRQQTTEKVVTPW